MTEYAPLNTTLIAMDPIFLDRQPVSKLSRNLMMLFYLTPQKVYADACSSDNKLYLMSQGALISQQQHCCQMLVFKKPLHGHLVLEPSEAATQHQELKPVV